MISVYDATDYKQFLKAWLADRPNGGRGESRRIAEKLAVSTTLVSQVISGDKHFTMEAASDLADHLSLTERETDHFLLLVDYARAGSHGLKARLAKRIERSKVSAQKLIARYEIDRVLSDTEAAIFYSHWSYSAIANIIAIDSRLSTDDLADRLKVPATLVGKVMSFLVESGIVVSQGGAHEAGIRSTHIPAGSPLVVKHHQNWRLQAFNSMPFAKQGDVFYTFPMSLSKEVADQIHAELPAFVESIMKRVGPSPSEVARCLNIDWFEY